MGGNKMPNYPFKNLIFEGGGVLGLAYVGALEVIEKKQILKNIVRVGGASAGAINATLLSLGYTNKELKDIFLKLDFNNFLDDSWGYFRDADRLITDFGWYKGDYFRDWIGELIKKKTGNEHSTFKELSLNKEYKELFLIGTNISTGFSEVFSSEHTPRESVADAVRISMSVPLFFRAIQNTRDDYYVDGGMVNNYPVKLFDREKYIAKSMLRKNGRKTDYYNKQNREIKKTSSKYIFNNETLGFRLDKREVIAMFRDKAEPPRNKINDFFDYAGALIKTLMNIQNNQHLHSDDWQRTIYIDTTGFDWLDFKMEKKEKQKLIVEGINGTKKYFEWYDANDPKDPPINFSG